MSTDTYPISQVEGFVERIDELEAEAKQFKEAIVKAVGSMDRASNAIDGLSQRITEMESEAKMIRDVEAWSTSRIVVIRRQIGVFLAQDFQSGKAAASPTIHGALFALRAKVEGGVQ